MSLLLNVPFAEKEEAKALGAHWNPELKKWHVNKKSNYPKFQKWFPDNTWLIICGSLYIVEGYRRCWKCGRITRIIGFGFENYYELCDPEDSDFDFIYHNGILHISAFFEPFPQCLLDYIQERYNYKQAYSHTAKGYYMANTCDHCGSIQGNWPLFNEPDGLFFAFDRAITKNLTLNKISLIYDLPIYDVDDMTYFDEQMSIKNYGELVKIGDLNHAINKMFSL